MNALTLSIVLIHGGFVDGSGWEGVYNILKKDGYQVAIVQNPTTSPSPSGSSRAKRARSCWSGTRTAVS